MPPTAISAHLPLKWTAPDGIPVTRLFHYTNGAGLLGILGVKGIELRATGINYLNDTGEARRGLEAYSVRMQESRLDDAARTSPNWDVGSLGDLRRAVQAQKDAPPGLANSYVTSFTTLKDDLSQWQAYSTDMDSYCIEFDRSKLVSLATKLEDCWTLRKCLYSNASDIDRLIDDDIDKLRGSRGGYAHFGILRAAHNFAIAFKDEAFKHEQEWRLVHDGHGCDWNSKTHTQSVGFTVGLRTLRPHVTVPFDRDCVTRVWVGPTSDPATTRSAVDQLLSVRGYEVPTERSKITYRGRP